MAKFNFKLGSILKLNESIEDQKKNEFAKAAAELNRQRGMLNALVLEKGSCVAGFQNAVKERIDPQQNDMRGKYIKLLSKRIEAKTIDVKKCEDILESRRIELIEATKEKKKLEKLKEKQYEQYIIDEKREEQKITDEVVGYKVFARIS